MAAGLRATHQLARSRLLEMTSSYEHAVASVVSCGVGAQWWDVGMIILYSFVVCLLTVYTDGKAVVVSCFTFVLTSIGVAGVLPQILMY